MTSQHIQPPPRLLLGATLLFWGAMSGQSLLALIIALIIESPNWIRSRWNFNDQACLRAWYLSLILSILIAIPIWLDGSRAHAFPKLLTWLPVLLFPVQFIQSFGFSNSLNLNNFYFISRIHRKINEELGIEHSNVRFNFGNVYFIAIIVAASLSPYAQQKTFFFGLIILSGWLMLAHVRRRIFAIITILIFAAAIGLSGQIGLSKLYVWATNHYHGDGGIPSYDHTHNRTFIGSLGRIKQSPEMMWRIIPKEGHQPPSLIKTSSYNRYRGVNWGNIYPRSLIQEEVDFRELTSIDLEVDNSFYLLREDMNRADITKPLPEFEIRGATAYGDPLPLPGDTSTLNEFQHQGIEINLMGTVRIYPLKSIIQGNVRWNDEITTEPPPFPVEDLKIDEYEIEAIHEVADALGLKQLATTNEKIQRIKKFFDTEFVYSRYLTIGRAQGSKKRPTPIETFLTTNKNGHCEYFATAATLLLRAADVPARYSIGFSVMEKNDSRNEWIIRGTHAHAWTRVWNKELRQWVDFDPTPSGWLSAETLSKNRYQSFLDGFQRFKEDFFLWRNKPANRIGVTIAMWGLGLFFILYIAIRLKKSRVVIHSKKSSLASDLSTLKTPLHRIEKAAIKVIGPRNLGETWITWLRKLKANQISESDLEQAFDLHQQLRFDPNPPNNNIHQQLAEITQKLIKQLSKP